ncbi:MAG TPA: diacylglycerol kinase family protein [Pyrinomonadaceae bacterium]|jgi:YegS/Rv2252/BmrU family lipid kinase|nr:diacylglycerol kinase family protein [Pyrinomonadaceae bacterium]
MSVVIVNPSSAGGSTGEAWPQIASDLRSQFGSFRAVFTTHRGDAAALASEAARKGAKLIIACGGDGTVSEVANGILSSGKEAELGILPSGTGGDFRRTLEIPSRTRDAARVLRTGRSVRIDVGRVSYTDQNGADATRYFVGVASCGMSTKVIERVKSDDVSFVSALLKTAMRNAPVRLVVQLDDSHEHHLVVSNLCIANARYFGGGMKIAPDAKLTDGKFDVVSIGDLSAMKIFTSAPRIYTGSHLSMPEVSHTLARKITVRAADRAAEVALEVDGELPGRLPATFQIIPDALRVRVNTHN